MDRCASQRDVQQGNGKKSRSKNAHAGDLPGLEIAAAENDGTHCQGVSAQTQAEGKDAVG